MARKRPTNSGPAARQVEALHAIRLTAIEQGVWPKASIESWRRIAEHADRRIDTGGVLSDLEVRAKEVVQAARKRTAWEQAHPDQIKTTRTKEQHA